MNDDKLELKFDKKEDKFHAMIQFFGISPNGEPMIMCQIYEGEKEIDVEEIKKLISQKESKIVLLGNQNKTNQLEVLDQILKEEYDYIPLMIDYSFNFQ